MLVTSLLFGDTLNVKISIQHLILVTNVRHQHQCSRKALESSEYELSRKVQHLNFIFGDATRHICTDYQATPGYAKIWISCL